MKLGTKFSLIAIGIVVATSISLELISFLVFSRATHDLNKELFAKEVNRLILLAYEQDELFFEGIYTSEIEPKLRVKDKIRIEYREQKKQNVYPFIIDFNGEVVIHPTYYQRAGVAPQGNESNQAIFDKNTLASMKEKKEGEIEYVDGGIRRWCVFKTYQPWDWIFCITTTAAEKNKALIYFLKIALLISLAVIILSILMVMAISRKYIRSIRLVIEKLSDIATGKTGFDQGANFGSLPKDEIGMLSHAVNKMASDLQKTTVSINALRDEQKRFRDVAINTDEWIWEVDGQGLYAYSSPVVEQILGYKTEEIIGRKYFYDFFHPDEREKLKKEMFEVFNKKVSFKNLINLNARKDGKKLIMETSGVPILNDEGKLLGYRGVDRDITEQKKTEQELIKRREEFKDQALKLNVVLKDLVKAHEIMSSMLDDNNQAREKLVQQIDELKRTQDMLVQSEKLASLGKLIAEIAHEVNNPLMIISGNAQLSLMTDVQNDEVRKSLKIIVDECQRAKSIIQRLLKFSKPSKGVIKDVDINQAVDSVLTLLEHQFSLSNVEIKRSYASNLPFIPIDEQQVHEVFLNILNNARDAMPGGGSISIITSLDDPFVRIDIKDTGQGMTEKVLKGIFEPFFTTKEKGTGLGLAVCYDIVKAHAGRIEYTSKIRQGTTASIFLPCKKEGGSDA